MKPAPQVKICGITREQDALLAAELGAWAVGFIFYPASPRAIRPESAASIIRVLPKNLKKIGVFVDAGADAIRSAVEVSGVDGIQLHGREVPESCIGLPGDVWKAFRLRSADDIADMENYPMVDAFLLDAVSEKGLGGTGELAAWDLAHLASTRFSRVILSGGLKPENVAQAIAAVQPYAVDVASGVEESPGIKSADRLRGFFKAIKEGA